MEGIKHTNFNKLILQATIETATKFKIKNGFISPIPDNFPQSLIDMNSYTPFATQPRMTKPP